MSRLVSTKVIGVEVCQRSLGFGVGGGIECCDCVSLAVLSSQGSVLLAKCAIAEGNRRAVKSDLSRIRYAANFEHSLAAGRRAVFNSRAVLRVASGGVSRLVGVAVEAFRRSCGSLVATIEFECVSLAVFSSQGSVCRAECACAEGNFCAAERDFAGVGYAFNLEHCLATGSRAVGDFCAVLRPACRSRSRFVGVAVEASLRRCGSLVATIEYERVGVAVLSSQGSVCLTE